MKASLGRRHCYRRREARHSGRPYNAQLTSLPPWRQNHAGHGGKPCGQGGHKINLVHKARASVNGACTQTLVSHCISVLYSTTRCLMASIRSEQSALQRLWKTFANHTVDLRRVGRLTLVGNSITDLPSPLPPNHTGRTHPEEIDIHMFATIDTHTPSSTRSAASAKRRNGCESMACFSRSFPSRKNATAASPSMTRGDWLT